MEEFNDNHGFRVHEEYLTLDGLYVVYFAYHNPVHGVPAIKFPARVQELDPIA